jgi:hypothetical protein
MIIDMVTPEVMKERRDICAACEFNKAGICAKCSCIIWAKTQLKNAWCPIHKWSKSQ